MKKILKRENLTVMVMVGKEDLTMVMTTVTEGSTIEKMGREKTPVIDQDTMMVLLEEGKEEVEEDLEDSTTNQEMILELEVEVPIEDPDSEEEEELVEDLEKVSKVEKDLQEKEEISEKEDLAVLQEEIEVVQEF